MQAKEILIPVVRQKLKHKDGTIGEVLGTTSQYPKVVYVKVGNGIETFTIADCEPVPEEPRPLRIGDKVCAQDTPNGKPFYSTVTAICPEGERGLQLVNWWFKPEEVRHATPEEVAKYFLTA